MHEIRPDYSLPASDLSIQSERRFLNQLALWLLKVKMFQPERKYVYYCGSTHHYFILNWSNIICGKGRVYQ
ncbi:MAG TPA: hypothetical protein ENI29_11610 [bacterium]|nr:hypothetical protein [archaeon]HEC38873.1 hypothetical protein [bacterium]